MNQGQESRWQRWFPWDLVRSVESSVDEKSLTIPDGEVPLPPGRPSRKGFSKSRLRAEKEKYHSGSSQNTSVGDESGTSVDDEKVDALTTDEDVLSPEVQEVTEGTTAGASLSPATLEASRKLSRPRGSGALAGPLELAFDIGVSKRTSRCGSRSSRGSVEQTGRRSGRHRTWKLNKSDEAETRDQVPVSTRKFSFTDLSLMEVWNAIREEISIDWMHEFWEVVLTAPYPEACKTLAMRPLGNWVTIYNNWQSLGRWRPGHAPQFFNAYDTQQIFELPWTRVVELIELFDKANAGDSLEDNVAAQLPVDALLAVCVLLSKVISKKQKIRFLLGIFDGNDSRLFDKEKFMKMMKALYHGTASMFGIQDTNVERIEILGEVLGDTTSLPSALIEEWLLGHSDDPLNLPFVLFAERFSEAQKFRLSHQSPVQLPLETALSVDSRGFLTRHEVIAINRIFNRCLSIGSFDISHTDAEKALDGIHMDLVDLWMERLCPALDILEETRRRETWKGLLKQLCPKATGRHLRMFHSWIKEFEQLEGLKLEVQETHQVLRRFKTSFSQQPATPEDNVKEIILEEEKIRQMERLFSPRLLGATVPSGRLLKCHVSKEKWQTWNRTLDLLDVEDQEPQEFQFWADCPSPFLVVYVNAAAHKDYIVGELGIHQFPALVLQKGTMSAMDAPLETFALRFQAGQLPLLDAIRSWIQKVLDTSKA
eukprot:s424_g16.t1